MNGHASLRRGFGLVELMVALALGLLVAGGATVLLIGTKQANGTSDNLSRMQESARTSHDLMTREIRQAGGTPCDAQLVTTNVLNNAQGGAPTWWATWGEPVRGYIGVTAFPAADFGTAVAERVNGTAALIVRYAAAIDNLAVASHDSVNAQFTANRSNHGIAAGELLMVCSYRQASILQVTSVNLGTGTFAHLDATGVPGNCSKGLGIPMSCATPVGTPYEYAAGAQIGRLMAVGWYIGNNGRPQTGGRSLYRVTRLGAEEVAEGVRDMQLLFLVSGGTDYVAASAVADWTQVMAMRLDMVYESPDAGFNTNTTGSRMTRPVGFTVNFRNLQP